MKPRTRRDLWLFAALLPVVLYAAIAERLTWRPKFIHLPAHEILKSQPLNLGWFHDSRRLACVNANKVFIIDAVTGKIEKTLKTDWEHDWGEPQITPDDKILMVGTVNPCDSIHGCRSNGTGEIRVIDITTGELVQSFPGDREFQIDGDKLHTVFLTPDVKPHIDKRWIKLPYEARTYNWRTGKLLSRVQLTIPSDLLNAELSSGVLTSAAWPRNGQQLVAAFNGILINETWADSGGRNINTRVFDVESGQLVGQSPLSNIASTSDRAIIGGVLHASEGDRLQIINADTLKRVSDVPWRSLMIPLTLSSDGKYAVCAAASDEIRIIWCKTGYTQRHIRFNNEDDFGYSLKFSPNSRTLAVGGQNGTLTLWRVN